MRRTLVIGNVVVPAQSAGSVSVAYEEFGGITWPPLRMQNGAGVMQQSWLKLRLRISGEGIVPAAFAGLSRTAQYVLKSPASRSVHGDTNVIAVPAARRTDTGYTPRGFAVVNGLYYATPLSMAGDVATLTAVPGAAGYGVIYWPQLTVFINPSQSADSAGASHNFVLEAEEV